MLFLLTELLIYSLNVGKEYRTCKIELKKQTFFALFVSPIGFSWLVEDKEISIFPEFSAKSEVFERSIISMSSAIV